MLEIARVFTESNARTHTNLAFVAFSAEEIGAEHSRRFLVWKDKNGVIGYGNVQGPKLKKAQTVLVVCDSGTRSSQVVNTLRKNGVETVFSLQGGLGAWQRENLPIVSGKDA